MDEKNPSTSDIRDLLDPLEVVLALGGIVEAPVGSTAILVTVFVKDLDDIQNDYSHTLGVFQNKVAGEVALRNWILGRWQDTETAPWQDDNEYVRGDEYKAKEESYCQSKKDQEIIKDYFDGNKYDEYTIKITKIQGPPVRKRLL